MQDVLKKRKQYAVLNEQVSASKNMNAGVTQGSILGSLLFFIYIDPIQSGFFRAATNRGEPKMLPP